MLTRRSLITAAALSVSPTAAAPGVGDLVYPAVIEPKRLECEARYGRLLGNRGDGEHALKLEAEYAFSRALAGALSRAAALLCRIVFVIRSGDAGGTRYARRKAQKVRRS